MKQRWLVAIIGLPLLLAVLLFCPPWATAILVCAIAGVAAYELLHVAGKNADRVVYALTVADAAAQVAKIYFARAFLDFETCFPYLEENSAAGLPDPELLIRTGGELRLSNFLLWQCAYSEFYVTDTLWPDFGRDELDRALDWYRTRDRRFGGLSTKK